MNQPEFEKYKSLSDPHNPFCSLYELDDGSSFYIEPIFYTHLKAYEEHFKDRYQEILDKMEEVVRRNKKVVFTGNYECPQTEVEGYIFLEIQDITNPLQIFIDDKSNPDSDWKD